jgi:aminoglycoside 3-N-acetyltransferase
MFSWLPKTIKQTIKGNWKSIRLAHLRRKHSFGKEDLQQLLRKLGLTRGDVVLVHSSLDHFEGFTGKPRDILTALQEVVGIEGTLLMPTLPFTGSAVEYVSQTALFDLVKTPSRMGLLTELFRRSPGVVRSVHPTHPVAVWGARADEMTAGHHLANTPCGRQTPYRRLLERQGKILFLGTDIEVMTFFHTIEEEIESRMPFSPFTKQVFSLKSRDQYGNTLETHTRLFDPMYSRRRRLDLLIPVLKEGGSWKTGRVGRLQAILVSAQDVLAAAKELAGKGKYCYEL